MKSLLSISSCEKFLLPLISLPHHPRGGLASQENSGSGLSPAGSSLVLEVPLFRLHQF